MASKLREVPDPEAYFGKCWSNWEDADPPDPDQTETRELLCQAAASSASWTWPTASEMKVIDAVISIAHAANNLVLSFSVRQVANDAGVSTGEAQKTLKRLRDRRLLEMTRKGQGKEASTWDLSPMTTQIASSASDSRIIRVESDGDPPSNHPITDGFPNNSPTERISVHGLSVREVKKVLSHDAFRHRGLGSTWHTYKALLLLGAGSPAEVSDMSGAGYSTVTGHLRLLAKHGIARNKDGRWWIGEIIDDDLSSVADDVGTSGRGEKQRAADEAARKKYRVWLDQRSARHWGNLNPKRLNGQRLRPTHS
jgi:hypothetical protein